MLKRLLSRDIEEFCNIQKITEQGIIVLDKNEVVIYKVEPINMVAYDENVKNSIYNSYLSTIRGLPNAFQIVVAKERGSLKSEIEQYKKRLLMVENYGLKLALKKYIEYLEKIEKDNCLYNTDHYLITEVINGEINHIIPVFSNLKEFGIKITRLVTKKDVEGVLRRLIL